MWYLRLGRPRYPGITVRFRQQTGKSQISEDVSAIRSFEFVRNGFLLTVIVGVNSVTTFARKKEKKISYFRNILKKQTQKKKDWLTNTCLKNWTENTKKNMKEIVAKVNKVRQTMPPVRTKTISGHTVYCRGMCKTETEGNVMKKTTE